jgi:hypothetical protein
MVTVPEAPTTAEATLPNKKATYPPGAWQRTETGEPMPDVVAAIQQVRGEIRPKESSSGPVS